MAGKPAAPQARGDRVNFIINRMSRCSAIELPRLVARTTAELAPGQLA